MVCPVCKTQASQDVDRCRSCGAYLGLLKRQPARVARCIFASIALGLGIFIALAWQVFGPLLRGCPAGRPGPWFWSGFCLATIFLALGLTARRHLTDYLSKIFRVSRR